MKPKSLIYDDINFRIADYLDYDYCFAPCPDYLGDLLRAVRVAKKIYADWDSPHKWSHPLYMELNEALEALPKGLLDE